MTTEPRGTKKFRGTGPAIAFLGVGLFLASLALPKSWLRDRSWDESRAVEYQNASAELHQLSLTAEGDPEAMQRLRESRIVYADLDAQRQAAARTAGSRRAGLRWGGLGMTVLGAWLARQPAPRR